MRPIVSAHRATKNDHKNDMQGPRKTHIERVGYVGPYHAVLPGSSRQGKARHHPESERNGAPKQSLRTYIKALELAHGFRILSQGPL